LVYGLVVWSPVLGPLIFVLYSAEVLSTVVKQFGMSVHGYADELQLYDHADPSESMLLVLRLSDCVEAVKARMASSRLCLNPSSQNSSGLVPPGTSALPDGPTEHSWCVGTVENHGKKW